MMEPFEYEARGSSYMFLRKQGNMTSGLSSSMQPSLELCMFLVRETEVHAHWGVSNAR